MNRTCLCWMALCLTATLLACSEDAADAVDAVVDADAAADAHLHFIDGNGLGDGGDDLFADLQGFFRRIQILDDYGEFVAA